MLNVWNFPVKKRCFWFGQEKLKLSRSSPSGPDEALRIPLYARASAMFALSTNPKCKRLCVSSGVQRRLFAVLNLWFEVQYSPTLKNEFGFCFPIPPPTLPSIFRQHHSITSPTYINSPYSSSCLIANLIATSHASFLPCGRPRPARILM